MRVLILGAGIGGLTCAHMLVKLAVLISTIIHEPLDILVVERNEQVGGQARSIGKVADQTHSEYCWHALAERYHILLNVINELGLMNRLRPFYKYIYALKDSTYVEYELPFITQKSYFGFLKGFYGLYGKLPPLKDLILLPLTLFYINSVSQERIETQYSKVLWSTFVQNFGANIKRWLLDSTAIFFGMDYASLGADMMFNRIRQNARAAILDKFENFRNCTYFSFTDNINRAWLDPWQKYLESKGVKFLLNTEVQDFVLAHNNTVAAVKVVNHTPKSPNAKDSVTLPCDYVFNCLSLDTAGRMLEWYRTLSTLCRQIQCQVTAYCPKFSTEVNTPDKGSVLIHPESKWFIMSRVESSFWDTDFECLAIGVGMWDVPGDLVKKPAINCTPEEIVAEAWHQISESKFIKEQVPDRDLAASKLWYSHVFDSEKKEITTFEPKNTNTVGTWSLRPNPNSTDLVVPNMFQATSYCKTTMNVANMEGAAEAACEAVIAFIKELDPNLSAQEASLRDFVYLDAYEKPGLIYRVLQSIDAWWIHLWG
jgi:uncharacterized protein with NAD-binding domain and iron-sulfur cluster